MGKYRSLISIGSADGLHEVKATGVFDGTLANVVAQMSPSVHGFCCKTLIKLPDSTVPKLITCRTGLQKFKTQTCIG